MVKNLNQRKEIDLKPSDQNSNSPLATVFGLYCQKKVYDNPFNPYKVQQSTLEVLYNGVEMRWPIGKQIYNGQTSFFPDSRYVIQQPLWPIKLIFEFKQRTEYYYFSPKD